MDRELRHLEHQRVLLAEHWSVPYRTAVRAQLHVIDLARQLETVEQNLRRSPARRTSESDEG